MECHWVFTTGESSRFRDSASLYHHSVIKVSWRCWSGCSGSRRSAVGWFARWSCGKSISWEWKRPEEQLPENLTFWYTVILWVCPSDSRLEQCEDFFTSKPNTSYSVSLLRRSNRPGCWEWNSGWPTDCNSSTDSNPQDQKCDLGHSAIQTRAAKWTELWTWKRL